MFTVLAVRDITSTVKDNKTESCTQEDVVPAESVLNESKSMSALSQPSKDDF
jgi:hypothetical protein